MCGIAGFVDRSVSLAEAQARLGGMLRTMVHRGPDGEGVFLAASSGLSMGMRRLSIIDLDGGWQPVYNEDRTVAVVFNGEIYNHKELTAELAARGHVFATHSDTEVLVHLYEEMGEKMLGKLRGMFAFSIWDAKTRKLFLARDPFGQKPLYWTADGAGRLAYASETKALLALPWVSRDLCPESYLDFASWLSLPAPRTHFKRIFSMPPGHFTVVDLSAEVPAGGITPREYWAFDTREEALAGPVFTDPEKAVDALHEALSHSVKIHLRADVPLGVLLSGGLDSRLVTAYARQHHTGALEAFTASFEGNGAEDETDEARRTASQFGLRQRVVPLGPKDLLADFDQVARHLDHPVGDPAAFAVRRVCLAAKEHVKVLLGGEGSDELFAGYEGRYGGIRATLRRTAQVRPWLGWTGWDAGQLPVSRLDKLRARSAMGPMEELLAMRQEGLPLGAGDLRVLGPAQLRRLAARRAALAGGLCRPQRDTLFAAQALDMRWQLASSLLLKADEMSMAASIELRCPFLSTDLAALAARLPEAMRLPEGGPGKRVLRRLMERLHPETGVRPKKGFPLPLAAWLRGPLSGAAREAVLAPSSMACAHLGRARVEAAWNAFAAGSDGAARVFYALWLYETWAAGVKA